MNPEESAKDRAEAQARAEENPVEEVEGEETEDEE